MGCLLVSTGEACGEEVFRGEAFRDENRPGFDEGKGDDCQRASVEGEVLGR